MKQQTAEIPDWTGLRILWCIFCVVTVSTRYNPIFIRICTIHLSVTCKSEISICIYIIVLIISPFICAKVQMLHIKVKIIRIYEYSLVRTSRSVNKRELCINFNDQRNPCLNRTVHDQEISLNRNVVEVDNCLNRTPI